LAAAGRLIRYPHRIAPEQGPNPTLTLVANSSRPPRIADCRLAGDPACPDSGSSTDLVNSPPVAYAADATPGLMKLESRSGSPSDWRRVSGRRPFDQLRPRARPPVGPGRRFVPGLVAPGPRGARGADCLPRDVLRHTPPEQFAGDTLFATVAGLDVHQMF